MKFYTFALLMLAAFNVKAQNYKYVEPGKQWQFSVSGAFFPPFILTKYIRHDSVLLAGNFYHPQVDVSEHGQHLSTTYWREDNQKVYRKYSTTSPEKLIYDWNMMVGDTVNKTIEFVEGFAIVDSVTNNFMGSGRKKWYLSQYCDSKFYGRYEIIEGIGANIREYEDQKCYVFETHSRLLCVQTSSGNQIYSTCYEPDNKLVKRKHWVTSHKDPGSNVSIYTRYKFNRIGLEIENKWELLSTKDRQGDNNWQASGRMFSGLEYEIIDGKQYKLFDFNLQKGDTFKLEFPNEPNTFLVVDSTDFVLLLDQREYKRLILHSPSAPGITFTWVEGVGDIERFIHYRQAVYGTETKKYTLTCYYHNYNLYYRASNSNNCDLKSAVYESSSPDVKLLFYPNPATDYLHIITDDELTIEVYSLIGQKLISENVDQEKDIDISMLEKGTYILCAENNKGDKKIHKAFIKL